MNKVEVIKSFPGLKVGDVLVYNELTDLYEFTNESTEIMEDGEEVTFSAISLSPSLMEEGIHEYFIPVVEESVFKHSYKESDLNIASPVELSTKLNDIVSELEEMDNSDAPVDEIYRDMLLNTLWTLEWVGGLIQGLDEDNTCEDGE